VVLGLVEQPVGGDLVISEITLKPQRPSHAKMKPILSRIWENGIQADLNSLAKRKERLSAKHLSSPTGLMS